MLEALLLSGRRLLALQYVLLSELSFGLLVRSCSLLLGLEEFLFVSFLDLSVFCIELGLEGSKGVVLRGRPCEGVHCRLKSCPAIDENLRDVCRRSVLLSNTSDQRRGDLADLLVGGASGTQDRVAGRRSEGRRVLRLRGRLELGLIALGGARCREGQLLLVQDT